MKVNIWKNVHGFSYFFDSQISLNGKSHLEVTALICREIIQVIHRAENFTGLFVVFPKCYICIILNMSFASFDMWNSALDRNNKIGQNSKQGSAMI
jgi:hypothetical protein